MEYAIYDRMSGDLVQRIKANDTGDCLQKYLDSHPEFNCENLEEMFTKFPMLMAALNMAVIH